ncbi:hypothetical protein SAMN02745746_02745 [Pseudogulbenkiania subflava DSM 22618]|uniref:Uncharacterized protein n=1 Tax=Pseudogulbenkiania subflava DSM 22618 TaxID=1123014 RepID=A0A1Y6C3T3_9NEIS|nr:hypothetical protein SAMN02745746_02745 [Pseudogulbenkiania subflava DSM 22618]
MTLESCVTATAQNWQAEGRTRSKMMVVENIYQTLDTLLTADDSRVVNWDGRILRVHKLSSRKATQILQSPDAFPGLLGVFDQRATYRDLADSLGDILGIRL